MHLVWQENMYGPPLNLYMPKLVILLTGLKKKRDVGAKNSGSPNP